MSTLTHLEPDVFRNFALKTFSRPEIKGPIAVIAAYILWVFDYDLSAILSLYILIFVDSLTGVICAIKDKNLSSRGVYRTAIKLMVYFTMLLMCKIADKYIPISELSALFPAIKSLTAFKLMQFALVSTELFSIIENFGKLGFPIPSKLARILRIYNVTEKSEKDKGK